MPKTIIAEGKTTNEAIANGLKELKVPKDKVDIKIIETGEKRSFFSILAPRVVKVELTLKENMKEAINDYSSKEESKVHKREDKKMDVKEVSIAINNINQFLKEFLANFQDVIYKITNDREFIYVEITGENSAKLIGYRGEVLNSLQTIINSIASKGCESKIRVILDIGNYKAKREKALEELAEKLAKTVMRTGKSVTLEPMMAYERKVIHNQLQKNKAIKTYSIGEEPYRKVIIAKNK